MKTRIRFRRERHGDPGISEDPFPPETQLTDSELNQIEELNGGLFGDLDFRLRGPLEKPPSGLVFCCSLTRVLDSREI
jgi:hypothetical protein